MVWVRYRLMRYHVQLARAAVALLLPVFRPSLNFNTGRALWVDGFAVTLTLEQIQFLLGHVSIQTTERYLGCKQRIQSAVNDRIGIEPNP